MQRIEEEEKGTGDTAKFLNGAKNRSNRICREWKCRNTLWPLRISNICSSVRNLATDQGFFESEFSDRFVCTLHVLAL